MEKNVSNIRKASESKKLKIILTVLLVAAIGLPMAYAHPSDEWLIENAIAGVKAANPKHISTEFTGIVTTGEHEHAWLDAPPHNHVTLTASFGYGKTGTVRWEGRSYHDGGIYAMYYSNHNPDTPKISTKVLYLGLAEYWDGSQWVTNHPESIFNSGDGKCTVLILGTNGLNRTIELGKNYSLLVYPPIGVRITLSILP